MNKTLTVLLASCVAAGAALALPFGQIVVLDEILWVSSATEDAAIVVGGSAAGGGCVWMEESGAQVLSPASGCMDISGNGWIVGYDANPEGILAACRWRLDALDNPLFLGTLPGSEPMGEEINKAYCVSADGSVISGFHWYAPGYGTAKAWKWTEETGAVLLPGVMNYADSRVDDLSADGAVFAGYAGDTLSSVWQAAIWRGDSLSILPSASGGFTNLRSISADGAWCGGTDGWQGAVWHDGVEVDHFGPDLPNRMTQIRHINNDGWGCGETANFNTGVQTPVLWNPADGLVEALDYFAQSGATPPAGFDLERVVWMNAEHTAFIGGGFDNTQMTWCGWILKLPAAWPPHLPVATSHHDTVELAWRLDEDTPGLVGFNVRRDGELLAQPGPEARACVLAGEPAGAHLYEISARYDEFGESPAASLSHDAQLEVYVPRDLAGEGLEHGASLRWRAPESPEGLTNYHLLRDGASVAVTADTAFTEEGLVDGSYHYTVVAAFDDGYLSVPGAEIEVVVGASDVANGTRPDFHLGAWPTPFNPSTMVEFALPTAGAVELAVYNLQGREVRRLAAGSLPAGLHRVAWDACDETGRPVASGLYLLRLRAGERQLVTRVQLLR